MIRGLPREIKRYNHHPPHGTPCGFLLQIAKLLSIDLDFWPVLTPKLQTSGSEGKMK